jgi:hypothetical protein
MMQYYINATQWDEQEISNNKKQFKIPPRPGYNSEEKK